MISSSLTGGALGVAAISPPEKLAHENAFRSEKAYKSFLANSASDYMRYWDSLAKEIQWRQPPGSTMDSSNCFPGGKLNLTESLIAGWQENEPMFSIYKDGSLKIVSAGMAKGYIGTICKQFQNMELSPGDRVLVAISSGFELLCACFAAFRLGITAVPVDPSTGDPRRLSRRAQAAGCTAALAWRGDLDTGIMEQQEFQKLPVRKTQVLELDWESSSCPMPPAFWVNASEPAMVLANSYGSMFALPTAGLAVHGLSAYRHLLNGKARGDLHWFQTPVNHASFLAGSIGALLEGGQVACPVKIQSMSMELFKSALNSIRPRVLVCSGKIMNSVLARSEGLSSTESIGFVPDLLVLDGSSISPSLFLKVRHDLFKGQTHVVQVLSRPEVSGYIAGPNPGTSSVKPGSCSHPAPGIRLVIADQSGKACQPFHGGFLAIDSIVPGMAISLQSLQPPIILPVKARQDRDELIWPVGEKEIKQEDDVRIPSTEIEAFISSQPGVRAAAVVAVKDKAKGTRTRAFVVAQKPEHVELISRLKKSIAEHFGARYIPETFQIVPDLPVSRSGKLLRSVLRRVVLGDTDGIEQLEQVTDRKLLNMLVKGSEIFADPERDEHGSSGTV